MRENLSLAMSSLVGTRSVVKRNCKNLSLSDSTTNRPQLIPHSSTRNTSVSLMTDALPDDGLATSPAALKLIAAGLSLPDDAVIPKRRIAAWAFWDWGGSAFNAIMTTFVFSVYLTSTGFGN